MSNNLIVLGIDDGHSGIKLYAGLDQNGNEVKLTVPSIAYSGRMLNGDPDDVDLQIMKVGSNTFTVGRKINSKIVLDTRTDEYPISDHNKALIHQAIRFYCDHAGINDLQKKHFAIATSLPVSRYYAGDYKNTELIKLKTDFLLNDTECFNVLDQRNHRSPNVIKKHIVLCEAQAAYFNEIIDVHGLPAENSQLFINTECAVIDIGGKTTDIVVTLEGGNMVDAGRSKSENLGILSIKDRISDLLKENGCQKVNANWLEFALDGNGTYGIGSQAKDITNLINSAKQEFMLNLVNFIGKQIGSGDDLALIVFCGGGTAFLENEINNHYSSYGNVRIAKDPEYANAKGIWKMANYLFKLGKS